MQGFVSNKRAFLLGLLLVSSFMGQWWMPLVIGIVMLLTESAYEVLFVGVVLDVVYAPVGETFFMMYSLAFLISWLIGELVRKQLLWN